MRIWKAVALAAAVAAAPAAARAQGAPPPACRPQGALKTARLIFPSGKALRVEVADSPASRERGLMCRTSLPRDYGMLFVFVREAPLGFWMKNTLVPLDMVWIGADRRVTSVAESVPASRLDTPDESVARAGGTGQFVLELPAGDARRHGLKAGDLLSFKVRLPSR